MSIALSLKRKTKAYFLRFKLHKLTEPFSSALLNLAYLSKFGAWREENSNPAFNDFYSPGWDFQRRYKLYEFLLDNQTLTNAINYLEFGVAKGDSFRWWVEHNKDSSSRFHGFDTFTGLPEDWDQFKAGAMSAGGNFPDILDNRIQFFKGLFQDTLPSFLKRLDNSKRKVIHLDADLYTSTLYVLTTIAPFLNEGDIIMFDEFGVPTHEFLAFTNFQASYRINLQLIGAANNYFFAAFIVKSLN